MVMFSTHYLVLRGFYAMEDTRTPFFIQVAIAAANVVLALVLTANAATIEVSTRLALAYGLAYGAGLIISVSVISRRIGRLADHEMVSFVARLVAVLALTAAVLLGGRWAWETVIGSNTGNWLMALSELLVVSALGVLAVLAGARLMRLAELRYVISSVLRR